jgi:serine/threonine protein kinase
MVTICPNEEELLAIASGDEPSAELRSHLQDCSRCLRKIDSLRGEVRELQRAFGSTEMEQLLSPPISPVISGPTPDLHQGDQPKTIGKYIVVGELGSGGQASVYRALHPTLDEQIVIKLSARSLDEGASPANDRLVSEGRVLCQLKHPNIGRIYDLDFFQRRPFLVMEYVRGRSLDRYARDRRLTSAEIAVLGAKIARALEVAHRLGVVHQDIKPQNIIIDETDEPKLIDFGMARLTGAYADSSLQPLGGTIQYMAPEQARSDAKKISGLSDVFALGAVLYFLLTGKPPFGGSKRDDNLARAQRGDFDRYALEKTDAPPRLKQIIFKAMAADPADRFASAGDLAAALEALDRAADRQKLLVRALPVVLILAAIAFTFWLWPRPSPIPPGGQILITPDGHSTLDGNLPLATGQNIKIEGRVPRDMPAAVFWVGATGNVFLMPAAQVHDPDQFDHVISPGRLGTIPVGGQPGTEFVLIVARRDLADPKNVEALRAQLQSFFTAHALAPLPQSAAVILDAAGARAKYLDDSRDPGFETADSCATVSGPLDTLGKQLEQQGYFIAGIAVPHEDKNASDTAPAQ